MKVKVEVTTKELNDMQVCPKALACLIRYDLEFDINQDYPEYSVEVTVDDKLTEVNL